MKLSPPGLLRQYLYFFGDDDEDDEDEDDEDEDDEDEDDEDDDDDDDDDGESPDTRLPRSPGPLFPPGTAARSGLCDWHRGQSWASGWAAFPYGRIGFTDPSRGFINQSRCSINQKSDSNKSPMRVRNHRNQNTNFR